MEDLNCTIGEEALDRIALALGLSSFLIFFFLSNLVTRDNNRRKSFGANFVRIDQPTP